MTDADDQWLDRLLDHLGVGACVIDHVAQRIVHANDACARLVGASSAASLVGQDVLALYTDPKERAEIATRLMANDEFRATGKARIHVRRIRQDTRELVDLTMRIAGRFDDAGRLTHLDCVLDDASDPRLTERAFRLSEERFRVLFDTNSAAMALADLGGRLTRVNQAFCRLTGRTEALLLGEDLLSLFAPEDRPERPAPRGARGGDSGTGFALGERRFARPDGQLTWGLVTGSWLADDGAPDGMVVVIQDITDRKRAEQDQQRIARLEALGLLAGGIAHDFNNVLAVVLASLSLVERQRDLDPLTRELVGNAAGASRRAADLARQLVTFSRGGTPSKRVGSVATVVKEAAAFCLRGSNVRVEVDIAPDLWCCEFDAGQASQVMNNLLINAVQAMPAGGVIHVDVRNVTVEAGAVSPAAPGRYVCVSVRDEGLGIEPGHLERVFDPYFTTKSKGSGLGLATAHSIVTKHGGYLLAESAPGRGSTFRMFLPATDAVDALRPDAPPAPPPRRGARVLVMDDDDDVRAVAVRLASALGLVADGVRDGARAIAAYEAAIAERRAYDVVILDLTVAGGMGGEETLARLRDIDPTVIAIVASGYSASAAMNEWRERGFKAVLEKPFDKESFKAVVHSVLAASSDETAR